MAAKTHLTILCVAILVLTPASAAAQESLSAGADEKAAGQASFDANFLAFVQDIAPGRVATIAAIMEFIGRISGGLLL